MSTIETVKGPFTRIQQEPINLNSHQQVKEFLLREGWKPTQYNRRKEEDGRWVTTSPKLTEDSFASIKGEMGQALVRRNVIRHRRNTIKNFKDPTKGIVNLMRSDGRVPADAITCGTPTARYTHMGAVCNVPGGGAILGEELRKCYICIPPYRMLGADLDAIEARIMAHFTMPYDGGAIAKDLLVKKGEPDWHKKNAEEVYSPYRPKQPVTRRDGKSISYGLIYGAKAPKVAEMLGIPLGKARQLFDYFWEYNVGLGTLKEKLERQYRAKGYIVGLDGRKLFIRQEYKLLNSLFQSAAAIVFKKWMVLADEGLRKSGNDIKQIIAYHDELQYRCLDVDVDACIPLIESTCLEAGEHFGIRVPVTSSCIVGANWFDTH